MLDTKHSQEMLLWRANICLGTWSPRCQLCKKKSKEHLQEQARQKSWKQQRAGQIEDTKGSLKGWSQREENDIRYKCGRKQVPDYACMEFGFYFKCNEKPSNSFKSGRNMIRFLQRLQRQLSKELIESEKE